MIEFIKKSYNMIYKNRVKLFYFSIIFLFVFLDLSARSGGAGGKKGGGGIGYIIYFVIRIFIRLPFPLNIIAIAVVLTIVYLAYKYNLQSSAFNELPSNGTHRQAGSYKNFIIKTPKFSEDLFLKKVKTAFMEISAAWQLQDLARVRNYISDGIYQRFYTQFKMMSLLDQKNIIKKLEIKSMMIVKVESDGDFDVIDVAISAEIDDKFISKKYPKLNSGGYEHFVEYWSFIKKRGAVEKDIFFSDNCPNCGAELPKNMGEVSCCSFCSSIVNSAEYDWILSEITQSDDYLLKGNLSSKSAKVNKKIRDILSEEKGFSVQLIEDKASNGFLQIQTAKILKKPAIMRRFTSDFAFEKFKKSISEYDIVYDRLYLNDVSLIGAFEQEETLILAISIKSSFKRMKLDNNELIEIDDSVLSRNEILLLKRDKIINRSKGSLYAHSCPGCGVSLQDTLNVECNYCGLELNSSKNEWIIDDMLNSIEYSNYLLQQKSEKVASLNIKDLDSLYEVRDFAFNNVLIMLARDGTVNELELAFAKKLAKKWGYNIGKINHIFEMAKSGRLVIRMPEKISYRKKIYKLMEKAANSDNNICLSEKKLLEQIRERYLNQV